MLSWEGLGTSFFVLKLHVVTPTDRFPLCEDLEGLHLGRYTSPWMMPCRHCIVFSRICI
jgi:hypothetical protein